MKLTVRELRLENQRLEEEVECLKERLESEHENVHFMIQDRRITAAMAVMQGLWTNQESLEAICEVTKVTGQDIFGTFATVARKQADALLAELAKSSKPEGGDACSE